jgi:hypothetical protein
MLKRAILACLFIAPALGAQGGDSTTSRGRHYVGTLVLGAATSIMIHEAAHVTSSLAMGGHPTFGFDDARPTIYSGITLDRSPRKQFVFSAAGLTVQNLMDELILDIPHARGNAFERGLLGGGIGTTLFYLTIGRTGSVSDVEYIARTHVMTKTQVTFVYGSIIASHMWRMSRDPHYANFFSRPGPNGLDLGFSLGR